MNSPNPSKFRRSFITAVLTLAIVSGVSVPSIHASQEQVHSLKCTNCHRFDKAQEPGNGPDLFYAGNKFQKDWLIGFLQTPEVIRKAGPNADPGFLKGQPEYQPPHPSVKKEDALSLADYLMSLKLENLEPVTVNPAPLSKVEKVKTKILFERDHSCIACHESVNLVGNPRGGISGPSLLNAGNRLQASWVYLWLKQPGDFQLKSRMPRTPLDEKALINLTRYVLSHKKNPSKP